MWEREGWRGVSGRGSCDGGVCEMDMWIFIWGTVTKLMIGVE